VQARTAVFSRQPGVGAPDPPQPLRGEDIGRQARRLGASLVDDDDPIGGRRGKGEVVDDDQRTESTASASPCSQPSRPAS
jgi:hypothetical protein